MYGLLLLAPMQSELKGGERIGKNVLQKTTDAGRRGPLQQPQAADIARTPDPPRRHAERESNQGETECPNPVELEDRQNHKAGAGSGCMHSGAVHIFSLQLPHSHSIHLYIIQTCVCLPA
mmetsp:Transcript_7768/g.15119  ORF Transcript_7768/g.15119 Transcript_7768/m.15119 type:complete len:120 (-) Transcript_7768:128-487(-)